MRSQSFKNKKRCQPKFSSFNADRELLSVTRVTGEIEKICVCESFAVANLTIYCPFFFFFFFFFAAAAAVATDVLLT